MQEYDEDAKITTGIRPKRKYRHFKRRGIKRKLFLVKPYALWPDTKQEILKYARKCRNLGYRVQSDTFGSSGQFAVYAWNQDNIKLPQIADITSILDHQDEEQYNWQVKHFPIAKELALYSIELLKRIVEGEQVSIGKMIQEHAISKHNLQLPEGTIRGLRVVRPEGVFPSPFQKMGLNSWMKNWLRIPKEKALMILD